MAETDAELVQSVLEGETGSFRTLVERYQDAVFGVAFSKTGSFADAEDIAQETFLAAFESLHQLAEPARFGAWLYRIAVNTASKRIRRDRRREKRHESLPSPARGGMTPDEAVQRDETRGEVLAAVRRLPEASREAATLYYIDGYSTADIGRFTGRPVGTIRRRLHDARKRLRKELVTMVEDQLKKSRPGKEFTDKVVTTVERVRIWQGGSEGQTTLMLVDSKGRSYRGPMGDYEAEVVLRSITGREPSEPPDLHTALLQLLDRFGHRVERVGLAWSSAPNLKVTVELKDGAERASTVEADYDMRNATQFAVQTGAPVVIDDELAEGWAARRADGKPMSPGGAWRTVPKGKRPMFRDITAVLKALERNPDSGHSRQAVREAVPDYGTETPWVTDATNGQDQLLQWHSAKQGTPLAALADGVLGAYHQYPNGKSKKALPYLERAHRLAPEDERVAFDLASAYTAQGRRKEALDLIESYHFEDAGKCGNFATLWKDPRFLRTVGEPKPRVRPAFIIKGTCEKIISAHCEKGLRLRKGATSLKSLGASRMRSLAQCLAQGALVGVARLHDTVGPKEKPRLVAETDAGHALAIPTPPWPDPRDQDLSIVLSDQVTPWRRRSEFALDLLKGVGVRIEAAVLLSGQGDIVGTLVARANGRRELVPIDAISAVLLVAEGARPLLITEALAEKLYVRGKSGRPLTPRGAKRKLTAG